MKKLRLTSAIAISFLINSNWLIAQTNTFPSTGRAGVGITTPAALLHLNETSNPLNISGAKSPTSLFIAQGTDAGIESIADNNNGFWGGFIALAAANSAGLVDKWGIIRGTSNAGDKSFRITYGTSNWVNLNPLMFMINSDGNIGIGTDNPISKLSVNGRIRANEVKVLADISVPDYVFEDDYELRTLKETKQYITENKHLPEIPSASDIAKNGIDIGDMNMRLLKKIEELTLYAIQQENRLNKQSELIEQLQQQENRLDQQAELIKRIQAKLK